MSQSCTPHTSLRDLHLASACACLDHLLLLKSWFTLIGHNDFLNTFIIVVCSGTTFRVDSSTYVLIWGLHFYIISSKLEVFFFLLSMLMLIAQHLKAGVICSRCLASRYLKQEIHPADMSRITARSLIVAKRDGSVHHAGAWASLNTRDISGCQRHQEQEAICIILLSELWIN